MTEQGIKLARALLLPINPAAVIFLGVYTVVWGFWLANPWWTVFTQAGLYSVLAQVAPESFWGCLAIVAGGVICYGAIRRSYHALTLGASTGFWHWFMIAIFYFLGDAASTGGITCILFMLYSAFIYLNIRVNFRNNKKSDKILRR